MYSQKISDILAADDNDYVTSDGESLAQCYFYIFILGAGILYTVLFLVKYLKREFTIIFLILLGPLSCITYPIDKVGDGKAQAYNRWLTEFIYQVLIQPFHLLIYVVLIGSATDLARENAIYALACFAVMFPAEKFIKEMFGFRDKLGSPLSAFTTGALASKAMDLLKSKKGKSSSGGGSKDDSDSVNDGYEITPKTVDKDKEMGVADMGTNKTTSSDDPPPGGPPPDDPPSHNDNEEEEEKNKEKGDDGGDKDKEKDPEASNKSTSTNPDKKERKHYFSRPTIRQLRAIHNKRMTHKWGSTNKKQRRIKRAKKMGKMALKAGLGTLKYGTLAAVGTVGAAALVATGRGKEAGKLLASTAGGIAYGLGKNVYSGVKAKIKGARGAVNDYMPVFRTEEGAIKKQLKAYKSDEKKIKAAEASFKKRTGMDATYEELEQEMEDRFELERRGLEEGEIDKSLKTLHELEDSGIDREDALDQTAFAADIAFNGDLKKTDFADSKKLEKTIEAMAQNSIADKEFKSEEEKEAALEKARMAAAYHLSNAARIKKADIALPDKYINIGRLGGRQPKTTSTTLTLSTRDKQVITSLGIDAGTTHIKFNDEQQERIHNLTLQLESVNGDQLIEIANIAHKYAVDSSADSIIESYETAIEFLTKDDSLDESARKIIGKKKASQEEIIGEKIEMLSASRAYQIKRSDTAALQKVREEEKKFNDLTVEMARDFATTNGDKISSGASIDKEKQQLSENIERRLEKGTDDKGVDKKELSKITDDTITLAKYGLSEKK